MAASHRKAACRTPSHGANECEMLRFTPGVILSGVKSQGDETESKFWRGSGKVAASRSKTDEDVRLAHDRGRDLRAVFDMPVCSKKYLNVCDMDVLKNVTKAKQTLRNLFADPASCLSHLRFCSASRCSAPQNFDSSLRSSLRMTLGRSVSICKKTTGKSLSGD